jgi:hypothetical protein
MTVFLKDTTMADQAGDDATLTPIQRALKMKKAALAAKAPPPGARRADEQAAAARSASRSKPWMKKG